MRTLMFALATSVGLAVHPAIGHAQTEEYGSFKHYGDLPTALFLTGKISNGDSFELRRALREHNITLIVTASGGGSLYEGLQIGSIVNDKNISTYVPPEASCESSCSFVFFGGRNRKVNGELGVHQFYPSGPSAEQKIRRDTAASATQYTTSEVIGILNEFNTPPYVYEKMFGTDDIYYFDRTEKSSLTITSRNYERELRLVDAYIQRYPSVLKRPTPQSTIAKPVQRPASPTPQTKSEIYDNIDFFGSDLNSEGIRNISIYECRDYCDKNERCAAWSYVHSTRWCWPKYSVSNISLAADVSSGISNFEKIDNRIFDRPFIEATAMDIAGHDIMPNGIRNVSLQQCRKECQRLGNCIAFSYSTKMRWCFPKWGVTDLVDRIGVISGILNTD